MAERQVSRDEDPEEKAREDQQKRAAREAQFQGVRKEKAAVRQYLPWVVGGLFLLALMTIVATSGYRKENTTVANPAVPTTPVGITGAAAAQGAPGGSVAPIGTAPGSQINNASSPNSPGNNSGGTSPAGNSAGVSSGTVGSPGASPAMGSPTMGSPAGGG